MEVNTPQVRSDGGSKVLALFDFDGTITRKDTLFDFARYSFGEVVFLKRLLRIAPLLAAHKIGLVSATAAKEAFLSAFFGGMPVATFEQLATKYSLERVPALLRPKAKERIYSHLEQKHTVVIVSASAENWIKPWADLEGISVIGSILAIKNNKITGKLASKNCNGEEKVTRIKQVFDLSKYSYIYAYGDSKGDKQMLGLANEYFFRYFS
ncbi:HAD family hydrolase [Rhodoflexus sp.]